MKAKLIYFYDICIISITFLLLLFLFNLLNKEHVDVILFLGQSNMAGRGELAYVPKVNPDEAEEFRSISDPHKLYPIAAPFGGKENSRNINDNHYKSGGLVPAFLNSYYATTKRKVVAISASVGGTDINFWTKNNNVVTDYKRRVDKTLKWLNTHDYKIDHLFCVLCQGEADGRRGTPIKEYKEKLNLLCDTILNQKLGMQQTFIITIGQFNSDRYITCHSYDKIRGAQIDYCKESKVATIASGKFKDLKYMMKDEDHYQQKAYNIVGKEAGKNVGLWINSNVCHL